MARKRGSSNVGVLPGQLLLPHVSDGLTSEQRARFTALTSKRKDIFKTIIVDPAKLVRWGGTENLLKLMEQIDRGGTVKMVH